MRAMSDLIYRASDTPVPVDDARTRRVLDKTVEHRLKDVPSDLSPMVIGLRSPANSEEAKVACDFSVALYEDVLSLADLDRASIIRDIITS